MAQWFRWPNGPALLMILLAVDLINLVLKTIKVQLRRGKLKWYLLRHIANRGPDGISVDRLLQITVTDRAFGEAEMKDFTLAIDELRELRLIDAHDSQLRVNAKGA
jgi:hypothetical protein